jgi:sodium-dependent phosphate cotransporter
MMGEDKEEKKDDKGEWKIPHNGKVPWLQRVPPIVRIVGILAVLYVFLVSISLMSGGFKSMGKSFAKQILETTSNPFIGLFVGILATSVVQSSSTVTSIVVGMVAAGTLSVPCAVPIIMGANIGTTVTNTIVSLGYIGRREEFKRAFTCGTVHDFFNYLCVLLLLPMELITRLIFGKGVLESAAGAMTGVLAGSGKLKFTSPLKAIIKPVVKAMSGGLGEIITNKTFCCWMQVVLGVAILFVALWLITKLMRSLVLERMEVVLDRTVGRSAALGVAVGLIFTAIVQSSSVTTSILVPLAATGVVTVAQVFPITVGANIGTTVTAMLASLTGNPAGLQIALVHLLFNTSGTIIFIPLKALRMIPIRLAEGLAGLTMKSRWFAVAYVVILFFAIPALLIWLT